MLLDLINMNAVFFAHPGLYSIVYHLIALTLFLFLVILVKLVLPDREVAYFQFLDFYVASSFYASHKDRSNTLFHSLPMRLHLFRWVAFETSICAIRYYFVEKEFGVFS